MAAQNGWTMAGVTAASFYFWCSFPLSNHDFQFFLTSYSTTWKWNFIINRFQFSVLFVLHSAAAACYYPDGGLVEFLDYQSCSSEVNAVSMCCATKCTQHQDLCQSNGLCFNACTYDGDYDSRVFGQYWRQSCTDQSWESPLCLREVCTNSTVSQNKLADPDRCGSWWD